MADFNYLIQDDGSMLQKGCQGKSEGKSEDSLAEVKGYIGILM